LNDFNQTIPAILLNKILFFLQDEEAGMDEGITLVVTAFVMMCIKTVAENMFFFELIRMSIQIKVAIIGITFRKSLRLTPGSRAHHSEGQIMNLMQQVTSSSPVGSPVPYPTPRIFQPRVNPFACCCARAAVCPAGL
jgi:hypothetical protein